MVAIIAKVRVVEGKGAEFEELAKEHIANVRTNEGGKALTYSLHRSSTDPNLYIFYEKYLDADAMAAHGSADHQKAFGGKLRGIVAGRPEIERCEFIAGL